MTSFATINGSLILRNGKLLVGNPSCCCQTCPTSLSRFGESNPNTFYVGESCSDPALYPIREDELELGQQQIDHVKNWLEGNGYIFVSGSVDPGSSDPSCTACGGPDGTCDMYPGFLGAYGGCCPEGRYVPDGDDPEHGLFVNGQFNPEWYTGTGITGPFPWTSEPLPPCLQNPPT